MLYQADTRFRGEHLLRVKHLCSDQHKAALTAGKTTAYDPKRPWNYTWAMGQEDATWWGKEFNEPAMMLMARTASIAAVVTQDAPVQGSITQSAHIAPPLVVGNESLAGGGPRSNPPAKRKVPPVPKFNGGGGGTHATNKSGHSLCSDFQMGACGLAVGSGICPKDRSLRHQCNKCLSQTHGGNACGTSARRSNNQRFNKKRPGGT